MRKQLNKPRLAESADGLWKEMRSLQPMVMRDAGSRLVSPGFRVVCGKDFQWVKGPDGRGRLEVLEGFGALSRKASNAEVAEFHDDLEEDRIQVGYFTQPGYASGYGVQRLLLEVHAPEGQAFEAMSERLEDEKWAR